MNSQLKTKYPHHLHPETCSASLKILGSLADVLRLPIDYLALSLGQQQSANLDTILLSLAVPNLPLDHQIIQNH